MEAFIGARLLLLCIIIQLLSAVREAARHISVSSGCDPEDIELADPWSPIEAEMDSVCGKFKAARRSTHVMESEEDTDLEPLIAGGSEAKSAEYPSFVALTNADPRQPSSQLCGGILIHPRIVLSTRRCLHLKPMLQVSAGLLHPLGSGTPITPFKVCVTDQYNEISGRHDYGVAMLKEPFKLDDKIQPACLPKQPVSRGENAFALGIGDVEKKTRSKTLKVLAYKEAPCKNHVNIRYPEHSCYLPINGGKVCPGDFGGPILTTRNGKHYVLGLSRHIWTNCSAASKELSQFVDTFKERTGIMSLIHHCITGK